jgi:hypothetical protein
MFLIRLVYPERAIRPNLRSNEEQLPSASGRASLQCVRINISAWTPTAHNLSKLTIDKPPINIPSLKFTTNPNFEMTSLHQTSPNEEHVVHDRASTDEKLYSRWSSSSQVVVDRLPSQPLSCRGSARVQQGGSRWSSGSQATFDKASARALARHWMIVESSEDSPALKSSATMKNLCILYLSQRPLSLTASGPGMYCTASLSAYCPVPLGIATGHTQCVPIVISLK